MRPANLHRVDELIESFRSQARIPGVALAIVMNGEVVLAQGYGLRDTTAKLPMTSQTVYPIASTSKALNATVIGALVEQGMLDWDVAITRYLPRFRLKDPCASAQATLRDLVTMRTGLGRHDFVWLESPVPRSALAENLAALEFSGGFRARFEYNNLTPVVAGHVAEVVAGQSWESLVRELIIGPLGMTRTTTEPLQGDQVTQCYCENDRRELAPGWSCATATMAPAGGAIHSTVDDMARWLAANLEPSRTLRKLHAPQVFGGHDAAAPSTRARYALGWWADQYNGHARVSHTGYVPGMSTSAMLFPEQRTGLICFVNFGAARLARLINQYVFDALLNLTPEQTLAEKLAQYERAVTENRQRIASMPRVAGSSPSRNLDAFRGPYVHPCYGTIDIGVAGEALVFRRNRLSLPLEHWHYDVWAFAPNDLAEIHQPHPFDRGGRLLFEADAGGRIASLAIPFEPALAPIRFERQ